MSIKFKPLFLIFILELLISIPLYAQQQYDKYYTNREFTEFLSDSHLDKSVEGEAIDLDLLSATIFHLTNSERIKANLKELDFDNNLLKAAQLHSDKMIQFNFFSHINPFEKQWKTPSDRIFYFGSTYVSLSENIVSNNLLDYKGHTLDYRLETNAKGEEVYLDRFGNEILYSSYKSLAERLVTQWMNSKPHRENILNHKFNLLGCGCSIDENSSPIIIRCTQNFGKLE